VGGVRFPPQAQDDPMLLSRHFTSPESTMQMVFDAIPTKVVDCIVKDREGKTVFEAIDVEVPVAWSQQAADILASKYMRKAGVPGTGREISYRQTLGRIVQHIGKSARAQGILESAEEQHLFEAELAYVTAHQMVAFNSPVWFNVGITLYDIKGATDNYAVNLSGDEPVADRCPDAYDRPQGSACFILKPLDSLEGIFEQLTDEMRVFRGGSGAGANFSPIRSKHEKLSSGGYSSGLISFLRVFDVAAGSIKSGGTCLAPYQCVYTENGPVPVIELASRESFIALSYDPPAGRYKAKRAKAWLAGRKNVVRITTDKGAFDVTDDHPVKLSSGPYVLAGALTPGMSLFAGSVDTQQGYLRVHLRDGRKGKDRLHRLIATDVLGVDLEGKVVHHKDGNKLNNSIENLEITTQSDHAAQHNNEAVDAGSHAFQRQEVTASNHRVVSVTEIGVMDVYDVEVECPTADDKSPGTGHNFLIWPDRENTGSGIVVANTRRAAKLVCLDMDHIEVEDFIWWKVKEEKKAKALIAAGYSNDFNGEAYATVSGQNSNNSVRPTDEFMFAVEKGGEWALRNRDGSVHRMVNARGLWRQVAEAAWECADPAVMFDTTINSWHTVPNSGRINGANPCVEFHHNDETACNLASINLLQFLRVGNAFDATEEFDTDGFAQVVRVIITAMETIVDLASYPTKALALNSHSLRPLGLGYANLGALLMCRGLPYDSEPGRQEAASITALLTGLAYAQSARLAKRRGPFRWFAKNQEPMLRVMERHHSAAEDLVTESGHPLATQALEAWTIALALGRHYGYRNSQATVIAPTGCLVAGSMVLTDKGLVRIESLGDVDGAQWQDVDFKVQTDEGPKRATKFFVNGVDDVIEVKTSRGYMLRGTPKHQIKVLDASGSWAWRRFDDLAVGDRVPLAMGSMIGSPQLVELPACPKCLFLGPARSATTPAAMTADLAEFIGVFHASGSMHTKGIRLSLATGDQDAIERYSILAKTIFGIDAKVYPQQGYTFVEVHSHQIRSWWIACDFAKKTGNVYPAHIPDAVLASNDPVIYGAYLRGLFTGDGTVNGGVPCWSNRDESYVHEVQTMLLTLGMPTTRDFTMGGYSDEPVHRLRLASNRFCETFLSVVGFSAARKAALVKKSAREWHRFVDHQHDCLQGFFYDFVESTQLLEQQLTYDLSVPDNVTYIANGFVSHNTISFVMDCDTTGIEPDFSLVKYKALAGGGNMKIVNRCVPRALKALGYSPSDIDSVIDHIVGNVRAIEMLGADRMEVEALRPLAERAYDVKDVVNPQTLPALFGAMGKDATWKDLCKERDIDADRFAKLLLGHGTIEGCSLVSEYHIPVFDCAVAPRGSKRVIHWAGHILMLAATQPFLSGSASKTINAPNDATVEDIEEMYMLAWRRGVKAVAIYRDGSKGSQPLSSGGSDSVIVADPKPERRKLSNPRRGYTQKATIGDIDLYLHTGEYEDGSLGEIFVTVGKEGTTLSGLIDAVCIGVSCSLQYGVPLDVFVEKYVFTRYEPAGLVRGDARIKMATSILDYLFRHLGAHYLGRTDLVHVQVEEGHHDTWRPEAITNPDLPSSKSARVLVSDGDLCSTCQGPLKRTGTCQICTVCGTSVGGCGLAPRPVSIRP
jgi:ribonucleoside-diphosphate reductase alpha chain